MADGIWSMDIRHPAISHQPSAISHQPWLLSLTFLYLVECARPAAERGADERAFLATEDGAQAGARSRGPADDHRSLRPVPTRGTFHAARRASCRHLR